MCVSAVHIVCAKEPVKWYSGCRVLLLFHMLSSHALTSIVYNVTVKARFCKWRAACHVYSRLAIPTSLCFNESHSLYSCYLFINVTNDLTGKQPRGLVRGILSLTALSSAHFRCTISRCLIICSILPPIVLKMP
jgi:hypothetical protein